MGERELQLHACWTLDLGEDEFVRFTFQPLYCQKKNFRCPMTKWQWVLGPLWNLWRRKKLLPLPGIEFQLPSPRYGLCIQQVVSVPIYLYWAFGGIQTLTTPLPTGNRLYGKHAVPLGSYFCSDLHFCCPTESDTNSSRLFPPLRTIPLNAYRGGSSTRDSLNLSRHQGTYHLDTQTFLWVLSII